MKCFTKSRYITTAAFPSSTNFVIQSKLKGYQVSLASFVFIDPLLIAPWLHYLLGFERFFSLHSCFIVFLGIEVGLINFLCTSNVNMQQSTSLCIQKISVKMHNICEPYWLDSLCSELN